MIQNEKNDDECAVYLARTLVKSVAPDEYEFFDDIVSDEEQKSEGFKDRMLGFGIPIGEIASVSTALIIICKPIVQFLWDNSKESAKQFVREGAETARQAFTRKLKEWAASDNAEDIGFSLTERQLNGVFTLLEKDAAKLGLDEAVATKIKALLAAKFGKKDGSKNKSA